MQGNYGSLPRVGLVGLLAASVAACSSMGADVDETSGTGAARLVYGANDRVAYGDIAEARTRDWADATAALFPLDRVTCDAASCTLATRPLDDVVGELCAAEPLKGQPAGALCTAFLVGPDVMVTAGHCLEDCRFGQFPPLDTRLVFGFAADEAGQAPTSVPAGDVYECVEMLGRAFTGHHETAQDWAMFRLDRPVTGRTPLATAAPGSRVADDASLLVLGHPQGAALMAAGGGRVTLNDPGQPRFYSSLDHLPGNSGSPVLDAVTGIVLGVLVTTPSIAQFEPVETENGGLCQQERRCDEASGCGGSSAPSNWAGVMRIAAALACRDGVANGFESGLDCGGPECLPCGVGSRCTNDSDCTSARCEAGVCAPAFCEDGIRNNGEADVDCGAACPAACTIGQGCGDDFDCESVSCAAGLCAEPTCADGRFNGPESDVDCGGPCGPCRVGRGCGSELDCLSGICDFGTCFDPTCPDGVQNGAETGVDCGGGCFPCHSGEVCRESGDCVSGLCDGGLCRDETCRNGVLDAGEADVDCGGPCSPCPTGGACSTAVDCESNVCASGVCVERHCIDRCKNRGESDVDCGGADCNGCALGKRCRAASDCASETCEFGRCARRARFPFRHRDVTRR